MSVMHCGDVGCPCRNLPPAVDDTAALRAEVVRLRAAAADQAEQIAKWESVDRLWADLHIRVARAEQAVERAQQLCALAEHYNRGVMVASRVRDVLEGKP